MALTKTVTKVMPTGDMVGMHLKLEDDAVVVIDRDYMENYTRSEGATLATKMAIGTAMQKDIDEYKENKERYESAEYNTARQQIDDGLVL
jgi:hypothetical protein